MSASQASQAYQAVQVEPAYVGQSADRSSPTLIQLPQEVLHQILIHVSPTDILAFEHVCRRFKALSSPLLWRHVCITHFKYWTEDHRISVRLKHPVDESDWKQLYVARFQIDRKVSEHLDSILASQDSRTQKIWKIISHGYDAKDSLIRHLQVHPEAEDVLARRWYSRAVLNCLHRSLATEQWVKLNSAQERQVSLEAALGAFDLFVIRDGHGDLEDIALSLERVTQRFLEVHTHFADLTTQEKAIAIANHLRMQDLLGIQGQAQTHYHDLQNNFIGIALHSERHSSLPLISVAIYCCVAQRLGVDAHPCGFPFHVLAIILPPEGQILGGHEMNGTAASQPMYLDAFRSSEEVSVEVLKSQLVSMGAPHQDHVRLLGVAPTHEIVARCAKNIMVSIRTSHRDIARSGSPDMKFAFYAALWAFILLPSGHEGRAAITQQEQYLPVLLQHMEAEFRPDVCLMEKHHDMMFQRFGNAITDRLQAIRASDQAPKPVKARDSRALQEVRYKVGQVFQHRRYQYTAVVIGWDVECVASEQWISQMRVRDLPRGQHQSFYHVLVEDESIRYVAEENIQIVQRDPNDSLLALAGQYFKRWDNASKSFVSNIRDEYPDS